MEYGNSLLSLGNQKALNFSTSDVAAKEAAWKGPTALTEASAGSGLAVIIANNDDAVVEKKGNSVCLKEHDYIGLSTSVKPLPESQSPNELSLPETDLHLGLGLRLGPSKKTNNAEESEKIVPFPLTPKEAVLKTDMEHPAYAFAEVGHSVQKPWPNAGSMRPMASENLKSATSAKEFQSHMVSMHVQDHGEGTLRVGNTFYGGHSAALKNGTKRGYTEAMNEPARFNMATEMHPAVAVVAKNGDGDSKALPKHPQGAFRPNWAPQKSSALPAHWHGGLEQSPVHSFSSSKLTPTNAPQVEKPVSDRRPSAYQPHKASEAGVEPATNEPPPSKGQVVGWPPIPSYRKHTLAKPSEMFVKVNMDGMTVGRKVDLNAHISYEGLLTALEEMFQPSNSGGQGAASGRENHPNDAKQFKLLHGSDFFLTYEDQDGDWMLVGDVPWSMFVNMVRRLRITRGSEATGLVPRRHDKIK